MRSSAVISLEEACATSCPFPLQVRSSLFTFLSSQHRGSTVDPILVFAFLEALLNVLADYYASPTVTEHLVKDNFDTVLLLLEEMLSSSRHPLVSETATLKEIVTPPSLVAKLLSAAMGGLEGASAGRGATGVGQMPMTGNQALSSPLPWRKQGIRHKVRLL